MSQIASYELLQKSALNRLDLSSHREGALLRVGEGYGCIHPWPELGDETLDVLLEDLQGARVTTLVGRALECAERFTQDEFFCDSSGQRHTLESHATLPRLLFSEVQNAVKAGFSAVKVKRGKDWMRMRRKTTALMQAFPDLRWRFDFNGALTSHRELSQFLGSIPSSQVDFIEDPFMDESLAEHWRGVPLAHDRVIPQDLHLEQNYLIGKPALQSREQLTQLAGAHPDRVVFTSYMDHPLGQCFALSEASTFYASHGITTPPLCGLVTHQLYADTPYHALFPSYAPSLSMPERSALVELLERESWI